MCQAEGWTGQPRMTEGKSGPSGSSLSSVGGRHAGKTGREVSWCWWLQTPPGAERRAREHGGGGCASPGDTVSELMTSGQEGIREARRVRGHGELKVPPVNQGRWKREIPNTFRASSTVF